MITMSTLFGRSSTGRRGGNTIAPTIDVPSASDWTPVMLPRKEPEAHPHLHHHLRLLVDHDGFESGKVAEGETRGSLRRVSTAGHKLVTVSVGGEVVGKLPPSTSALLDQWVEQLNDRGYDVQVDIYNPGNGRPPQLLSATPTAVAQYLHTLLDHLPAPQTR